MKHIKDWKYLRNLPANQPKFFFCVALFCIGFGIAYHLMGNPVWIPCIFYFSGAIQFLYSYISYSKSK